MEKKRQQVLRSPKAIYRSKEFGRTIYYRSRSKTTNVDIFKKNTFTSLTKKSPSSSRVIFLLSFASSFVALAAVHVNTFLLKWTGETENFCKFLLVLILKAELEIKIQRRIAKLIIIIMICFLISLVIRQRKQHNIILSGS